MRSIFQGPGPAALWLLAASSTQVALAQTPPDAGSLLQQNEARKPAPLPEKKPALRAPEGSKPSSAKPGVTVLVHSFKLVGNTLIASEALQPLLASYVGRRLNLAELQAAAGLISDAYAARGWLARCYLPPQDTTAGVIELRVAEARFGGVRIEGKGRIDSARAERIVLAQQAQGDFVQLPALERGLLLVDDLAGTRANGALVAGQVDGQTQLAMTLSETPLFGGEVSLDNGGARSTGSTRINGVVALSSALGLGEQFTAQLTHSRGSDYARLGGAVPLGDHGWRLSAGVSGLHYRLTDFQGLEGHGSTEGADANLSYPIVRSRRLNLNAQLGYESRRFDNEANGSTTTKYRSSVATLGFNGNAFDDWHGGGVTLGSVAMSQGRLNLNGSPNFDLDAQTTQTNGDFNVLRYSLSREQRLDGNGDHLNVSDAIGTFDNPNPGRDKLVSIDGVTLGGTDADNYTLVSRSAASTTADISLWLLNPPPRQVLVPPLRVAMASPDAVLSVDERAMTLAIIDKHDGGSALVMAAPQANPAGRRIVLTLWAAGSERHCMSDGERGNPSTPAELVNPEGFELVLPKSLQDAAEAPAPTATACNGDALPTWLRFEPKTRRFIATLVPEGALPFEATVHVGKQTANLLVKEEGD